jgi:hypothetical protein
MGAPSLKYMENFDESTDRDDTGRDALKFFGSLAILALIGLMVAIGAPIYFFT